MTLSLHPSRGLPPSLPRIVAVGFRRINKMLQELAPQFADRARVEVLDMGYEQAVSGLRSLHRERPVDVVFLLVAPEGAGADHLKALARVSRLLRDRSLVDKLRATENADALYALLVETIQTQSAA